MRNRTLTRGVLSVATVVIAIFGWLSSMSQVNAQTAQNGVAGLKPVLINNVSFQIHSMTLSHLNGENSWDQVVIILDARSEGNVPIETYIDGPGTSIATNTGVTLEPGQSRIRSSGIITCQSHYMNDCLKDGDNMLSIIPKNDTVHIIIVIDLGTDAHAQKNLVSTRTIDVAVRLYMRSPHEQAHFVALTFADVPVRNNLLP